MKIASRSGAKVCAIGGGTRQGWGHPAQAEVWLSSARLKGLVYYDPGDLTLGVRAGTTLDELQAEVNPHRQWLPLDGAQPSQSTIAGVLATKAHGPLRAGFGGVRDFCIGIEFVTAEGKIAHGGGRVVKNVAGYDLMKLMIGSFGTLGFITAANFKLFPLPQQTATFRCEFPSLRETMRFRDEKLLAGTLQPMCAEVISPQANEYLSGEEVTRDPDEYAPVAPLREKVFETWTLLVRASGSDAVLRRYGQEFGEVQELRGPEEQKVWSRVSDFERRFRVRHQNAMLVHVETTLSEVEQAILTAQRSAEENNMLCAIVGRATAGALWIAFAPLSVDPPSAIQYANTVSSLRAGLSEHSSAAVAHCPRDAKMHFDLWGVPQSDVELMRGIKKMLDPNDMLSPGRFLL